MRFSPQHAIASRIVMGFCLLAVSLAAQTPDKPAPQPATHQAPMVERYGKPYVMVTINGKGPFRFVIDTGTGGDALVTPELATELGLPTVGHATLSDPSGQGAKRAPIVQIDSLEVAGVRFTGIRAISHSFFAEAGTCEGLLGFTLFRDYLLTLDFPDRLVTLSGGALATDGGKSVLPFRMPEGVPIAYLKVDGLQPVEAQLDSGGGGLVLPEKLAAHLNATTVQALIDNLVEARLDRTVPTPVHHGWRRRCARRSAATLDATRRSSVARFTRRATFSSGCPNRCTLRCGASCGKPGKWTMPKGPKRSFAISPAVSNGTGTAFPLRSWKGSTRCSLSPGSASLANCAARSPAPTSSRMSWARCAGSAATSNTGARPRWPCDGPPPPCRKRIKGFRRLKAYKHLPALRAALAKQGQQPPSDEALVQIAEAA